MKSGRAIKTGIIGLGRAGWGMQCSELASRTTRFNVVAGCDRYAPWLDRFKDRFPNACAVSDMHLLLSDPEVELVCIATRSCDHFDNAMIALAAGKYVFLEKPMCSTYAQAQALRVESAKGPGRLFVRHNRRFESTFIEVQKILRSGLLGEIIEVKLSRTSFGRRNDWQTLLRYGGGQLSNWGSHIIDHGLQFLEEQAHPMASIHSRLAKVAAVGDAEDHVKIVLTGNRGMIVDIEVSGGAALPTPTYLVWGTRGSLEGWEDRLRLRYLDPKVELSARSAFEGVPGSEFTLPNGELPLEARTIGSNFGQPETLTWVEEERTVPEGDPGVIWDALYADIREELPFPVTLDEAVEVMHVIDVARSESPFPSAV